MADSFINAFKSREDATQWVVLVVGIIATIFIVMRPRWKRRRDPMVEAARPQQFSLAQQRSLERDMNGLMVEMLETARKMAAQLETRSAKIEVLLQEADEKIAALQAGTRSGRRDLLEADHKSESPPEHRLLAPALSTEVSANSSESSESGQNDQNSHDLAEVPPDPRHAEVYSMADQGRSPHEIAKKLNRPNGEVELILALRPH